MKFNRFVVAFGLSTATVLSFAVSQRAGIGMGLGIVGAGFNLIALRLMTSVLGNFMKEDVGDEILLSKRARTSSGIIVMAFFIKLPLFVYLSILTRHIGGAALPCFLMGVGLVYSTLIWWALAPS